MTPHEFARLLDSHGPPLLLYARQWCGIPEDVVQEAFLKLFALGKPPHDIVPWLYRVVRNKAIDASRMAGRRGRREAAAGSRPPWFAEAEADGLRADDAVGALERLPAEEREVIITRLWGGLKFEQIAQVAVCSPSTAFRRYTAGIERLRKELSEDE
jgi:RNA polymerase sigma factor (sigma-70 family)